MELDYKAIGKRVKIARIRADLTQEALAEKAGRAVSDAHEQHRNGQFQIEPADGSVVGKRPGCFGG